MNNKLILILCVFAAFSCNKEGAPDIFKKTGEIVIVSRTLGSYTDVLIRDEFDVELIQDSQDKIESTFGKNVIDSVKFDFKLNKRSKNTLPEYELKGFLKNTNKANTHVSY